LSQRTRLEKPHKTPCGHERDLIALRCVGQLTAIASSGTCRAQHSPEASVCDLAQAARGRSLRHIEKFDSSAKILRPQGIYAFSETALGKRGSPSENSQPLGLRDAQRSLMSRLADHA
jgi:hypothetical protein